MGILVIEGKIYTRIPLEEYFSFEIEPKKRGNPK
jgi:hypothetical protein